MATDLPETKLLQLFDVLYDLRSVTRAAERLGQSQPTVSIWLGRLRRQLDDPLFVRGAGGMAPTPRAEALIGPCREILASLSRLAAAEPAFHPATSGRRFRICMTDASHITLLPPLLARVRALAPGVRLEAAGIDGATEQALTSGDADLAIGYVPWLGGAIARRPLFEQDWVCLANRRHPRVRERLGRRRYVAEGHVAIAAGTGATLLERALRDQGIERRVVLELPGFLGLGAIIGGTDLLATLPRHIGSTLAHGNDLALWPCPLPVDRFEVGQYWHPRFDNEPASRWLRELVVELFGSVATAG
ncbi:MAG: LysR family transcriptional regulator [Micropruina sp.]|uniref:LysR family transcriptional regulator n=1 Tax=Micropruina sp. TaxID=2737536 RepID=UPI0039E29ADB